MTDPVSTVVTDLKADATKVEATVKAGVTTAVTDVTSTWAKVKPWLTHIVAVVSGYLLANVSVVAALVTKLL